MLWQNADVAFGDPLQAVNPALQNYFLICYLYKNYLQVKEKLS